MHGSIYVRMKVVMLHPKPVNHYIHALEVLGYMRQCGEDSQKVALCIVTGTDGGGVRAPGAILAVNENGEMAGYMSNGCVDADLALQAQTAIEHGQLREIRYGAGSPFKDIRLPCGGGIDVMIIPRVDQELIISAIKILESRKAATLKAGRQGDLILLHDVHPAGWRDDYYNVPLAPHLRLRIAGQGAELMALSDIARAAQCRVIIETNDPLCLDYAARLNVPYHKLDRPDAIDLTLKDDPFTAFVILFHDHDWEGPLLQRALMSDAFYIGAMGSRTAHIARCKELTNMGVLAHDIAKIRAPIGLIPASRNANILAVSIMAEIIDLSGQLAMQIRPIS